MLPYKGEGLRSLLRAVIARLLRRSRKAEAFVPRLSAWASLLPPALLSEELSAFLRRHPDVLPLSLRRQLLLLGLLRPCRLFQGCCEPRWECPPCRARRCRRLPPRQVRALCHPRYLAGLLLSRALQMGFPRPLRSQPPSPSFIKASAIP
jgi:hypothetical protein